MLLNVPRCDYLTLTSFFGSDEIVASFSDLYPRQFGKETKMGGYQGHQWDGLFFGVGKQRRKSHFMLRASGEDSETIFWRTKDIDCNCTRIDIQVTIWLPRNYSAKTLFDTLSSADTQWPGRRLNPTIIQSGDGFDTVYIGSRTSDRFARVYVKPDREGKPAYLRFEMEFKGALANSARDAIREKYGTPKTILRNELDRLPFQASSGLRAFDGVLGVTGTKLRPETVMGQNSTLDWLEKQVEPAVIRMLHSHEHKDRMYEILCRWLANSPID